MMQLIKFVNDSGVVGWVIIAVGLGSLALMVERFYSLYFKYALNSNQFATKVQSLVSQNKYEEALVLCHDLKEKPLAQAYKTILEKSDQSEDSIFQAQDIALSETIPLVTKGLHHLSMAANVATLLGLLGTIHGLILSFAAVAQADPAQKQTLLANGVSVSMYTTALGLVVAIPLMIAYSFLVSKQNEIIEKIQEKTGKLTEQLTSFENAFHNSGTTSKSPSHKAPPPPSADKKAS